MLPNVFNAYALKRSAQDTIYCCIANTLIMGPYFFTNSEFDQYALGPNLLGWLYVKAEGCTTYDREDSNV